MEKLGAFLKAVVLAISLVLMVSHLISGQTVLFDQVLARLTER